jgi:ABC-type Fe3+-hydroxamate transport system substrate-binding protein
LVDYDREGRPDGIKYEKICIYLNENAKQQARELAELKARYQAQAEVVSAQQRELDELKNRLSSLEQLLRQVAAAAGGLPSGAAVAAAAAPLSGEAAR